MSQLNYGPVPEYWDESMLDRFLGLEMVEYEVLTEWLLMLVEKGFGYEELTIDRAFDTVLLLQEATRKLRQSANVT
ncbi:hypothetical protein H7U20_26235 [Rugamonas sp. CCM 8940]|uniref:hypothetical protein n=1 Tax=Rugamonas sp. CCM 8940 TaxID=2765359 RepID=UPI0018F35CC1|nr:hypothetical protein [Rugamonas sp. CCM 8940]MBJ7313672.1 hypothetical protein [Rugamonas sp. CCM 8940]